jgi:hypothetical protein
VVTLDDAEVGPEDPYLFLITCSDDLKTPPDPRFSQWQRAHATEFLLEGTLRQELDYTTHVMETVV